MNKTQKALKLAIEQMQHLIKIYIPSPEWSGTAIQEDCYETIQACKEALAQPAQEPVAWIEVTTHHEKYQTSKVILLDKGIKLPHDTLLYTHPAPSWQGLSDDDKKKLHKEHHLYIPTIEKIESMLKEKNHAAG